jgi:tetratricopeptide (TPR) repeat protein
MGDCDHALRVDRSLAEGWAVRALLRGDLAEAQLVSGKDPRQEAARAAADATEALKTAPKDEEALLARSRAYRTLGIFAGLQASAKDLKDFQRAADDAAAAAQSNPRSAAARREAAEAWLWWAALLEWRLDSGVAQYQNGLKAAEEGLSIDSADPDLQRLKAWALTLEANHDRRIGAVPTKKYEAAIKAADKAVQAAPNDYRAFTVRGDLLLGWVLWHRLQTEQDAVRDKHARGLQDIAKATSLNGSDPFPFVVRSRYYKAIQAGSASQSDAARAASLSKWFKVLVE